MRIHDRLLLDARPDADGKDFIERLNPNGLKVVTASEEPSFTKAKQGDNFFKRYVLCGGFMGLPCG